MKLRAEHCGVQFVVERYTERMVDAERYVRCILCGECIPHTWDDDLDHWEYLQDMLEGEPPIKLLKLLFTDYCRVNRHESFIEFYYKSIEEAE